MAGGQETKTAAEADMDLEFSRGADVPSFEFAFNSEKFSDKVLQVEVVAGDDVGGAPLPDSVRPNKEQADNGEIDCSSTMADTPILTVKALHINSVILAARSRFFLKLFSNGMNESDQTHPRIRIADSEENALMELLSYMYSGTLTTTEPTLLLDILMAADKFEVRVKGAGGLRTCLVGTLNQLLTSLPMTTESALLYIDHPCSTSMAAEVQHVIGVAKEFLANEYKDFHKFKDELMCISLAGIEAIFSNTDIQVVLEDYIYYFMLEWARARYLEPEERREILSCRLLPLVRFSHMTCAALQDILACTDNDIDHEQVIVYMDLKRDECSRFFPYKHIFSHCFWLAGWDFYLKAFCEMDKQSKLCSFGFCLGVHKNQKGLIDVTVHMELAARYGPSGKFVSGLEDKVTFDSPDWMEGCDDLFGVPWSTFIADDNLFIDGVLHLRADLRLVAGQPEIKS
ncbi:hypothetical protein ZWY2020_018967 [Hordeum vulgare]|nr:hypothetical protein ZWY2020_018967 [Hordeum vulgare]